MIGVEVTTQQQGMVGYGTLDRVLDTLEGALEASTYIAGEAFSAADVYVGAGLNWGVRMTHAIEERPAFARYLAVLGERPALKRANELDDTLAATLA